MKKLSPALQRNLLRVWKSGSSWFTDRTAPALIGRGLIYQKGTGNRGHAIYACTPEGVIEAARLDQLDDSQI